MVGFRPSKDAGPTTTIAPCSLRAARSSSRLVAIKTMPRPTIKATCALSRAGLRPIASKIHPDKHDGRQRGNPVRHGQCQCDVEGREVLLIGEDVVERQRNDGSGQRNAEQK